jgi:hypothetical protein
MDTQVKEFLATLALIALLLAAAYVEKSLPV